MRKFVYDEAEKMNVRREKQNKVLIERENLEGKVGLNKNKERK